MTRRRRFRTPAQQLLPERELVAPGQVTAVRWRMACRQAFTKWHQLRRQPGTITMCGERVPAGRKQQHRPWPRAHLVNAMQSEQMVVRVLLAAGCCARCVAYDARQAAA